jgi:hypothetical protein
MMALTGKAAKTASAWGAKAERWKGKAKASEAELERVKARLAELESKAVEPETAPETTTGLTVTMAPEPQVLDYSDIKAAWTSQGFDHNARRIS